MRSRDEFGVDSTRGLTAAALNSPKGFGVMDSCQNNGVQIDCTPGW